MFFIISSFSKFSRGVSCPYMVKLDPQITVFYVCREHIPRISGTELTGQDVGLRPPLFYCFEACPVLQLHGFVAKQACLVLCLSKSVFPKNH